MGWEFVVLIAACLCIAVGALVCDSGALYEGSSYVRHALLTSAATRTVAFPRLADDVGNWFEPLGVVSSSRSPQSSSRRYWCWRGGVRVVKKERDSP